MRRPLPFGVWVSVMVTVLFVGQQIMMTLLLPSQQQQHGPDSSSTAVRAEPGGPPTPPSRVDRRAPMPTAKRPAATEANPRISSSPGSRPESSPQARLVAAPLTAPPVSRVVARVPPVRRDPGSNAPRLGYQGYYQQPCPLAGASVNSQLDTVVQKSAAAARRPASSRSPPSGPRKCSIQLVRQLLARHQSGPRRGSVPHAVERAPLSVVSPKNKSAVVSLLDFPCDESEQHKCACQLQCRDASCTSAVEKCVADTRCDSIVLEDQKSWATLKRQPRPVELQLLEMRLMSARDAKEKVERITCDLRREASRAGPLPAVAGRADDEVDGFRTTRAANVTQLLPRDEELRLRRLLTGPRDAPDPNGLCTGGPLQSPPRATAPSSSAVGGAGSFDTVMRGRIGVVALTMASPATLMNAMATWSDSGFLALCHERLALLNTPLPAEVVIAEHFGFRVWQPKAMKNLDRGRMKGPNTLTIGSAFYHSLKLITADYVVFLEKDFAVDRALTQARILAELVAGMWLAEEGAFVVRLRSREDKGCSGFRECVDGRNRPIWDKVSPNARKRNWLSGYCADFRRTETFADCVGGSSHSTGAGAGAGPGRAEDAAYSPYFRCFTSYDSNWSLNAVLVRRETALETVLVKAAAEDGPRTPWEYGSLAQYGERHWNQQEGFERGMLKDWGALKVPICISFNGVFRHVEIDS